MPAADALEVFVGEVVALSNEGQRLSTVEMLSAGGQVGPGVRVLRRVVEADVDASELSREVVEAGEADFREMIDRHAQQLGQIGGRGLPPGLPASRLRGPSVV
jgi:hypothetical protein